MLSFLNETVFAILLPLLLLLSGTFFLIYLKGFPFGREKAMVKTMLAPRKDGVTPAKALMTALAGTLGVGNIVGVATAIHAGGAGAVFWMWVSALLVQPVKYGETVLAIRYRVGNPQKGYRGGPMYYISKGLHAPAVSALFCILCILASFFIGNIVQVKAVIQAWEVTFSVPPMFTAVVLAGLLALIIFGGGKRIFALTSRLIPCLTVGYLILSLAVLAANLSALPGLFSRILKEAFGLSAVVGGVTGFSVRQGIRYGVTRGLMSNEAGCGTAPIAHAAAQCRTGAEQGFFAIAEFWIDTLLLCSVTAMVILLSPGESVQAGDGMLLALSAFGSFFGKTAQDLLSLSVFFFALATLAGWSYYGLCALHYLTPRALPKTCYLLLYTLCAVLTAFLTTEFIWDWSDLLINALTILNTTSIFFLRKEVKEETKLFFGKRQPKRETKL